MLYVRTKTDKELFFIYGIQRQTVREKQIAKGKKTGGIIYKTEVQLG